MVVGCFAAGLVVAFNPAARAGEHAFVLREHLGLRWTQELVSFPFAADRGTCHPASVRLAGPAGMLPVQLSDVVMWPAGDGVRSARVNFVVAELPPASEQTYTLRYETRPTTEAIPGDLRITPAEGSVEFATSRFAARLLQGERAYPAPVPAAEVPGPVDAMRLADGTWFGGSRLYGSRHVIRYSAQLADRGPVFARGVIHYAYEDGTAMELSVRLIAGDSKITWHMNVQPGSGAVERAPRIARRRGAASARPESPGGWQLVLNRGLDSLLAELAPEYNDKYKWGQRSFTKESSWIFTPGDADLQREPVGAITSLVPWEDWWNSYTQAQWTFKTVSRGEVLRVAAIDPGVWIEPSAEGTWETWGSDRNREMFIPLVHGEDGAVYMEISAAAGQRRWEIGGVGETRPDAQRLHVQGAHTWTMPGAQVGVGRRLDQVKDLILAWPDTAEPVHPLLFGSRADVEAARRAITPEELGKLREKSRRTPAQPGDFHRSDADALAAYLLTGSAEVARETRVTERLAQHLGLLGNYDLMRNIKHITALYDGIIDSGLVSGRERIRLRAQMAYLGYLLADPSTWSVERGYCSANLNMSVSYILNRGLIACVLPDHPAAREWARPAIAMCDRWLDEQVGPAGEWPESVANYAHVSATGLLMFAVAARNAGLHDFINDPRLKRLMLYLAKQYTPLDPRSGGERPAGLSLLPPSGRSAAGKARAIPGIMAKAIAAGDPAFSRVQQWNWLRSGSSLFTGATPIGAEHVAVDRLLPAAPPDWGSELFPQLGAILRHGIGTPDEWYVNFLVPTFAADYVPSEYGAIAAVFARGVPIAGAFAGGYAEKEELFMSRVHRARGRGTDEERRQSLYHKGERRMGGFSALPRQDYLAADLTIETPVYRSLEAGPHDQMVPVPEWPAVPRGAQGPVNWRRQLLFVKGDRPADAGYFVMRDTVTGNEPTMWQMWTVSEKIGTPDQTRDLTAFLADKPGNRALPARKLPGDRFTAIGPFGVDTEFFVAGPAATPRHTLRWGKTYHYSPVDGFAEYMDLLHLQLPGDGSYYVAMFPRRREERPPEFDRLADGRIIRIQGEFGTDHAFLAAPAQAAAAEGIAFRGTAASVQDRRGGLVLALGAEGEIHFGEHFFAADAPASLRVEAGTLAIDVAAPGVSNLVIRVPGEWELVGPTAGVRIVDSGKEIRLTLDPGIGALRMRRK